MPERLAEALPDEGGQPSPQRLPRLRQSLGGQRAVLPVAARRRHVSITGGGGGGGGSGKGREGRWWWLVREKVDGGDG